MNIDIEILFRNKPIFNSMMHEKNVGNNIDMNSDNHGVVVINYTCPILTAKNNASDGQFQSNQHNISLISEQNLLVHDQQQQFQQNQQMMQEESGSGSSIPDDYVDHQDHQIGKHNLNVSTDYSSMSALNQYMFLPKSSLSNSVDHNGGKYS